MIGSCCVPEPGRIDASRSVPASFFGRRGGTRRLLAAALLAAASAWACISDAARPHPDLTLAWREYQTLPDVRAMAIAGLPGRGRWVTGASGGHASLERAEQEAIMQCRTRRARRRLQDACVLYAVGDEIVWQEP